jgi:branched-chain amino acid transport system permease protein
MHIVYAALLAGLSGWLYAHFLRFVSPGAFAVHAGIEYLFMAVIGGAGQVWGAVVGASVLTVLKEWLKDPEVLAALKMTPAQAEAWRLFIFSGSLT